MRKHTLLGSAAVLLLASYGAGAQTTSTAPNAQTTTPPSTSTTSQNTPSSSQTGVTQSSTSQPNPTGTNQPSTSATTQSPPATNTTSQSQPSTSAAQQQAPNTNPPSNSAATSAPPSANTAPTGTAQQTNPQPTAPQQPAQQQATQPNVGAPQTAQQNNSGVVTLNVQQRAQIGQVIARANVKPVTNVNFSISIGTAVPRSVAVHALPAELVAIVPQYRGYSYFVVEEQIVIVEPATYQIVAIVPFSGATHNRAAAPAPTNSKAVKLSTEQREVIRKHTSSSRTTSAPAATGTPRKRYRVGDEVDRTVTIETFPETVYTEVPDLRRYRYFRHDKDVILVDPDENRVVDVFD